MNFVALKMLVGDKAKYLGIIMGLTFASLLITQQAAIFLGLMTRTFGAITDLSYPDIWVMDRKVQFIDDIKPLQDTVLFRVRGISGVEWAVPLYKGLLKARLSNGNFQTCNVLGLDDATLVGGPPQIQHFVKSCMAGHRKVPYFDSQVRVTGILHVNVTKNPETGAVDSVYSLDVEQVEQL